MFISFLNDTGHRRETIVIPQMYQIKRLYQDNIKRLTQYHRTQRFFLNERNLVKRLIKELNVSADTELYTYVDNVRDRVGALSRLFNLSSPYNAGRALSVSQFLNSAATEIVILHGEQFDIDGAVANWAELEPVKFLDHPNTDLSYALPDGTYPVTDSGAAIISINLPMLALQYRMWVLQETKKENPLKLSTFVVGYPLNNAMRSHMDIAIFNRLANISKGTPELNKKRVQATAMALPNLTSSIDEVLKTYDRTVRSKRMSFYEILYYVPALTCGNFIYRAQIPSLPATDQIAWALYGSAIKKLAYLFRLNNELALALNQATINEVSWLTRRLNNDQVLQRGYPAELMELLIDVQDSLDLRKSTTR